MSADKPRRWTPLVIAIAVMLLALSPILYALSIGPAAWLASHGYISYETVFLGYRPVFMFFELFPGGSDALRDYAHIWERKN